MAISSKEQHKKLMKIFPGIAVAALFAALTAAPTFAQQPRSGSPAPTNSGATVPDSKIAVIYSEAFLDPQNGIARFNVLQKNLNREFQPRQTDLDQLKQKIQQLNDEIEKTRNVADPVALQKKVDQLEQLKKDYQRKGEDAQAELQKRQAEMFAPLEQDVGKALEAYAKAHGITVIIDLSRVPVVYVDDKIDITRAFISEFNSKNPATASAAAPGKP